MRRRRKIAMIAAAVAFGALLLAGAFSAGFRYLRYRSCRAAIAGAAKALAAADDPLLRADLEAHVEYLRARIGKGWLYAKRDVFLGRLRAECGFLLAAARGSPAEPHLAPGHHVIVTVSRVDGARMPTSVAVPEGWDGGSPLPLVLHFHAGGVTEMLHCFPAPSIAGALSAMPLARGSHDYLGVQMTAVEECVADVKRRYPVSATYVMGASQGGMGAWLYAERHAMEVSGVSPWAANADPAGWRGVWEPEGGPDAAKSPAGRAAMLYRASRSPVARVEQLVTSPRIPVFMAHGTEDVKIPIGHSESMHAKLREALGPCLRFDRLEGYGHRLPAIHDERLAWLSERSPEVAVARKKTAYRFPAVIPPLTFVAELYGAPPHRVFPDPLRPARFAVGDDRDRLLENENCECEPGYGPDKGHYPGPAGAAFDQPFSIALPRDAPAYLVQCADDFAALWERRYGAPPRRSDADTGFAVFGARDGFEKERRTLVALGSPEENPAVREAVFGMDVSVEAGRTRLFGRSLDGEDVGLVMLCAHRGDPYAGTLVVWGSTPGSYRQLWTRFGQAVDWEGDRGRWWFDYAVYDRRTAGPETFLAVGYFDHDWRFDARLLFLGSAELRAGIPGTHWPSGRPAADSGDTIQAGQGRTRPSMPSRPAQVNGSSTPVSCPRNRFGGVWLSSLAPVAVETLRGPVAFDRSAGADTGALTIHGKTYERGIGMVPPAAATWRLGGRYADLAVAVGLERTDGEFEIRREAERVRFEVLCDGELRAESGELSSADEPVGLEVALDGVDELTLRAVPATRHVWHCGPVGFGDAELASAPGSAEAPAPGAREQGVSPEGAVAIARRECEGRIVIPDDAIVETTKEGANIVVTFRIPIETPRPGASYYARIVVNARTGAVVLRFGPDA